MKDKDFVWVDSPKALGELAAVMAAEPWHALDLESNSGFAYFERLCLMQLNVGGRLWLVDLLALPGETRAIDPLRKALESREHTTFLHGGEFDVGCLKRDYELAPAGVWDSQQAASSLGWERTGYGVLVEKICGVELAKEYAHYDWSQRPIARAPLSYAVDDVRYLPEICHRLREEVAEADLEEEVEIAFGVVEGATWSGGFGPDSLWKVKGSGHLPREALPAFVALYEWRDATARRRDLPPGRVLNNASLLSLARNRPTNRRELHGSGLKGRAFGEYGAKILEVLAIALTAPPVVPSRPVPQRPEPHEQKCESRLRKWRQEEALRREVPQQVVLPSRALMYLKKHGTENLAEVPQLGAKRVRLYGDQLRELCGS